MIIHANAAAASAEQEKRNSNALLSVKRAC